MRVPCHDQILPFLSTVLLRNSIAWPAGPFLDLQRSCKFCFQNCTFCPLLSTFLGNKDLFILLYCIQGLKQCLTHSRYSVKTCDWQLQGGTVKFVRKMVFLSVGPEDGLALNGINYLAWRDLVHGKMDKNALIHVCEGLSTLCGARGVFTLRIQL